MYIIKRSLDHLLPFLFYLFVAFLAFVWSRFFFAYLREKLGREFDYTILLALALLLTIIFFLIVINFMDSSVKEVIENRKMYRVRK